jgi:hypothetical protein
LWVALADSNCYSYGNSNCNGYSNGYADSEANTYAKACSNTAAASNAAAASVTRLQPLDAGTRESLREFLQGAISLLPKFRMQYFGVRQFPPLFELRRTSKKS